MYFEDESRFGLLTRQKRVLTKRGVKPLCPYQHTFDTTYLFGAFSPFNGESCMLVLPYCNTHNFQVFLNEFSKQQPQEYKAKKVLPEAYFIVFRRFASLVEIDVNITSSITKKVVG